MHLLQKRLKDAAKPKIDFLTIAGDNYYPKKQQVDGKKKKIIIPSLLEKGFKSLPPEIPIYMILGNHDLETNTGNTSNFFIGDINDHEVNKPVEKDDCSIIKYEKMSKIKNGNIEYNLFKEFMLENGTLILMIDTSMYSEDVGKYLPCYNVFLDKEYTVEELRAYQLDLIMKTLTKYNDGEIKNLIIIGHHPIIGLKIKKEDDSARINDIIPFDNVLKEIYSRLKDTVNYFYLCADVHLYQEGEIVIKIDDIQTMKIKQYIVGTGGTELDTCANERNIGVAINDDPRLTYTMTKCEERCGFLECINTPDSLSFLFNEVPIEGGRKQSKKSRKQKKSKRKRIIKSKGKRIIKSKKRKKSRRKTIRVGMI
jgi:hypothetical protein